ncbi:MAG: hypothetical protein IJV06_01690 [Bacteroidaceae bacterium]|nr:hypothetical protein [Bacteroidaceae bacterium]
MKKNNLRVEKSVGGTIADNHIKKTRKNPKKTRKNMTMMKRKDNDEERNMQLNTGLRAKGSCFFLFFLVFFGFFLFFFRRAERKTHPKIK